MPIDEDKPKPPNGPPTACIARGLQTYCGRARKDDEFAFSSGDHASRFYAPDRKPPIIACIKCIAEFRRIQKGG
jgi:hypothetical protein